MKLNSTERYYRPELDALRFFAFFIIFCFHLTDYVPVPNNAALMGLLNMGAMGVPVFFMVSAFLIVELLLKEQLKTGNVHIKSFYIRRILRIWPLYFFVLGSFIVLAKFIPDVGPSTPGSCLAFLFFVGNWYIMKNGWIAGSVDPLWSIAVEEQFYILIPLLVKYGKKKTLRIVSFVLIIISVIVNVYYAQLIYSGESGQWVNGFFQFQFFAGGILLALYLKGSLPVVSIFKRMLLLMLGFVSWTVAIFCCKVKSYDAHTSIVSGVIGWLLVLVGAVLIVVSVLGIASNYVPKVIAYLGRISYGLYMFHSFILHTIFKSHFYLLQRLTYPLHLSETETFILGIVLSLLITICLAYISFHSLEKPFLKMKERFTFIQSRIMV